MMMDQNPMFQYFYFESFNASSLLISLPEFRDVKQPGPRRLVKGRGKYEVARQQNPATGILFSCPRGWLGGTYFCILEVWPSYTKRHSQVVMSHFLMVESAPPVMT